MGDFAPRRQRLIREALLIIGAVVALLPGGACDRSYRFVGSPVDDTITLPPLSNGWRPLVSTTSWRTSQASRHPVHSRLQQHLRSDEARKRAQATAESNKVEVYAPAPPTILGSFSRLKPRDRKKVSEQEELLPQGRIVYSARLIPPPVQTSPSNSFSSKEPRPHVLQPHKKEEEFAALMPPAKSAKVYYSRPSPLELFPSAISSSFSSQQQGGFFTPSYEDPLLAIKNNHHNSFSVPVNTHNSAIYLDPGHNVQSSAISSQQAFKALPDSLQFFKDFFEKHKAAYAEALNNQQQPFLGKQKTEPVIESVDLAREVFYGKHVIPNTHTNFNGDNGKLFLPFRVKNPSEVEIVHEKRPAAGLFSTPAPDNFGNSDNNNNLPIKGSNVYKYQVGLLTTPFSNPSHVYTSPTPLPLIQSTYATNSLPAVSSTVRPQINNEYKLNPVKFAMPTSVTLQPQSENGRIPRPYVKDKQTNDNIAGLLSVTNGHAPAQHIPQKTPIRYEKDTLVTFLPTIPPESQTVAPDQEYDERLTSPQSNVNEITPLPGRVRSTFKQSPTDTLDSHTSLTDINSFGIQKQIVPSSTIGYEEPDQFVFRTQKPHAVTFINGVPNTKPTNEPSLSEASRPQNKIPERNRQRVKPSRRPSTNSGGRVQNDFHLQRNPQRTKPSSDTPHSYMQNQQESYLSSSAAENEDVFTNNQNALPPRNQKPYVETDAMGNAMDTGDSVKYMNAKPSGVNRRPPVQQNENDYSEASKEDNMHSSTQTYYTRRPSAQQLVRENYDIEDTDLQEPSQEKENAHSSRRPSSQKPHPTRPQQLTRNNEQSPTRSPHPSRRRPQTHRDNLNTNDSDGYRWDQNDSQGTRTQRPRRPSSNRGQVSYHNTNANREYDGTRGRPNNRQRPTKFEITDTEIDEPERQTEIAGPQKYRSQASYNQAEADSSNTHVYNRRRKPANVNYNNGDHEEEEATTSLSQQTNGDILPGPQTLTNEVTSQIYSTTTRPTRRYPATQRLNKDRNSVPSSTHSFEVGDIPATLLSSHQSESHYNQAEPYQTIYKIGQDNTFSSSFEHKSVGKNKNSAPVKDFFPTQEVGNDEPSSEFTTTLQPVVTSALISTTTYTAGPTTTAPTTTSTSTTTTVSTTTTATTILPAPPETDSSPPETSTAAITSTSTSTNSPHYTPHKLRPRLRNGTNSSRPRFSIKDYRQRLNKNNDDEGQGDDSDKSDEDKPSATYHARYPSRTRGSDTYRREPGGSTSTTTEVSRTRYRYGDRPRTSSSRFRSTSTTTKKPESSTEKASGFRPNTSRYKPGAGKFYSRYRSSTPPSAEKLEEEESTNGVSSTTSRIIMNPKGVFSAMRRIYPLKMLTADQNNTTTKEEPAKPSASEVVHTLPPTFVITPQSTTEETTTPLRPEHSSTERIGILTTAAVDTDTWQSNHSTLQSFVGQNSHSGMENMFSSTIKDEEKTHVVVATGEKSSTPPSDLNGIENFSTPISVELQSPSQIVAGLTSAGTSSGFFKSANSLSARPTLRITMATEEPRLPIEAFFPVLSNKD